MRITKQREVILKILAERRDHPTAFEIYEHAKNLFPEISLSTVYRTLKEMVERGEVIEIRMDGETKARYDINTGNHAHFRCRNCGRIFDIDILFPLKLIGFKVEKVEVYIYGLCDECAKKEVIA
jgi:Fur family peroxide stress response transcriptional regulator